METNITQPPKFSDVLRLSCLYYAPICFLINFICALATNSSVMLIPIGSAIIFGICLAVAAIVAFNRKKKSTSTTLSVITAACCFFSPISFLTSGITYILLESGLSSFKIWNLWSLLIVLFLSVLLSILLHFLKIKNFLLSALLYYTITVSSFIGVIAGIGTATEGNVIMISFSIFSGIYVICAIIYFISRQSFRKSENEEKEYQRQFD